MMDLPVVGVFAQRQLQPVERGLIFALDEMNQADLIMACRVARLERDAALKCREGLVITPKLYQDTAKIEVRKEIIFEVRHDAEFFRSFGQQTMALVINTKCVVCLAQIRIMSDRAPILSYRLAHAVNTLKM